MGSLWLLNAPNFGAPVELQENGEGSKPFRQIVLEEVASQEEMIFHLPKHTHSRKGKEVVKKTVLIQNRDIKDGKKAIERPTNKITELNIATHNINGIKSNTHKLDLALNWAIDNKIDILGIAESNISSKEGCWLTSEQNNFRSFWSSSDQNKKKGSGVGLLINNQWEKYIGSIDRINEYIIIVNFMLKQLEIIVIMLYIPPNNEQEKKRARKVIIEKYINRSFNAQIIVMGDFNSILDSELDRTQNIERKWLKKDLLLNWLQRQEFQDSFRTMYPKAKKFTWSNGETSTRIDQIWVSEELSCGLFDTEIQEMDIYTSSDHAAMIARIDLGHLGATQSAASCRKKGYTRTVFLCDKATNENWEDYRKQLDSLLKKSTRIQNLLSVQSRHEKFQLDLDGLWEDISESIITAAKCNLPKKRVCNTLQNRRIKAKKSKLSNSLMQLGRWISVGRKSIKLDLVYDYITDLILELEYINQQHKTSINVVISHWSHELIDDLKGWWKILYAKRAEEIEQQRRKEIEENIERRHQMIDGKQGKMLASLLEKPYRKIQIDRLLEEKDNYKELITDPDEVLKRTKEHFQNQFRPRHFDQNLWEENWKEIYKPKKEIQEEWYEKLDHNVTEVEWLDMLKDLKKNSAPGVSGITYTLIKAASTQTQNLFRLFAECCIQTGRIPAKWKISQIYPIPKDTDWRYNLNNVRPIALLEAFRKCVTKVLTKRLSQVLAEKEILKGPNFAGLPGNSTEEPIQILNAIIEDATDNKKELWLVLQDMKKAFDSVSLRSLELAMKRLKIPQITIKFILNLFENRQSKIITDFGTTQCFETSEGIEQGEVISPLIWRIFYDPLLVKINEDPLLGYTVSQHIPLNYSLNSSISKDWKQAVIAYADDTTWIAKNKKQMERTIQIAEEFFKLNDIQINGKKSKLIIVNPSEKKEDRKLYFGKEWLLEEGKNKITRFLGVWLNNKLDETLVKARAKEIVRSTVRTLNPKKLTVAQAAYINNMCLVPKLCYILQVARFNEKIINSIQAPILALTKNRMELTKTTSNSTILHRGIGSCNALWNQLLSKQVFSLYLRLNAAGPEEILTSIRIKQGMQLLGANENSCFKDLPETCARLWKNNLACLTMWKAKDLKIRFKFSNTELQSDNKEFRLANILGRDFSRSVAAVLRKLGLISLKQLITQSGDHLITWQQLKILRKSSSRGKKAKWFQLIEEKVIEEKDSRLIKKDYRLNTSSSWALQTIPDLIEADKRKKEWILVKKTKENIDNSPEVRRILDKSKKKILTEHWKMNMDLDAQDTKIVRCEGCVLNKEKEENVCRSRLDKKRIQGSISRLVDNQNGKTLKIRQEMIYAPLILSSLEIPPNEESLQNIQIYDLDTEIIKKQQISPSMQNYLIEKNQLFQNSPITQFKFYTDGSLRSSIELSRTEESKMGASWVLVDEKEEEIVDEGYFGARNWPSSTKAELLGIWCVCLITPQKSKVKIYTDSAVAIERLEKRNGNLLIRQRLKEGNHNLVKCVLDIIKMKELQIEFSKVKGHDGNRWNDRADKLAKLGSKIIDKDRIIEKPPRESNVSLCWEDTPIEGPTRDFLQTIFDYKIGVEWKFTSAIKKIEPNDSKQTRYWHILWKKIKNQNGIRCTSSKKNRRLGVLVKCLSEKLPVLKTMASRRPDLYNNSMCILCLKGEEEDQEHLTTCEKYETRWKEAEHFGSNLAWTVLPEDTRSRLDKIQLKKILWGTSIEEIKETRSGTLKGLIKEETAKRIFELVGSSRDARSYLDTAINSTWNYFYENIWKQRCAFVNKWEKENGINKKKKREKKTRHVRSITSIEKTEQIFGEVNQNQEQTRGKVKKKGENNDKEKDIEKKEKSWFVAVKDLIKNRIRPFWYGL